MKEYRCTRNTCYSHDCLGHNDLRFRQGYYILANSEEEAWEKMAIRFPSEVEAGFTVEEGESFDVTIVEVKTDDE